VSVPEASVHERHLMQFWKDEVGFSGKVFTMQPEPVAHSVS
jgi:hypothetical protein